MNRQLQAIVTLAGLLIVGVSVGAEKSQQADNGFSLNGKPIHPMSVAPLVGDLADEQPIIAAVDLEGSAQNKSNGEKTTVEGGTVIARNGDGFVSYRDLGRTPGGLHVLVVMVNGGGSGVFEDALWVKFVRDTVWEGGKKRNRTMLVRIGQFTLGDRDDGEVKLDGAKLLVGKSRYRQHDEIIPLE
jgi:hypothetical protein